MAFSPKLLLVQESATVAVNTLASGDASRSHLRPRWLAELAARIRHAQHEYVQQKLRTLYEKLLRLAIANRYVTIAALTGLLIIASGAVFGGHVPFVF